LIIRITGTGEECEVATDRIVRVFDVWRVPPLSLRDDGLYQIRLDAQLREQDRPEPPAPSARHVGGLPLPRTRPRREP